jgi:hypothetical protein
MSSMWGMVPGISLHLRVGVAFIGIDCGHSGGLAALGVRNVLPNFRDFDRFVAAFRDAASNEAG